MQRRLNSIKDDSFLFLFCTLVCISSQINIELFEDVEFRFYPIALLSTFYIGFKFGTRAVYKSLAITITTLILLKGVFFKDPSALERESLSFFTSDSFCIYTEELCFVRQGFDDFIVLVFLAILFSIFLDRVQARLLTKGICIDELIPLRKVFFFKVLLKKMSTFLKSTNKESELFDFESKLTISKKSGIGFDLKTQFKKLSVVFLWFIMFFLSIEYSIKVDIDGYDEALSFNPIPMLSGELILLVYCYFRGFAESVFLLVIYCFLSFTLIFWLEGTEVTESLGVYPGYFDVGITAWIFTLLWWINKLKIAWQAPKITRKLFRFSLFRCCKSVKMPKKRLPFGAVLLLVLFSLSFQLVTKENNKVDQVVTQQENNNDKPKVVASNNSHKYSFLFINHDIFALFLITAALSMRYNSNSISNVLLVVCIISNFLMRPFMNLSVDETSIAIEFHSINAFQLILLCLLPKVFEYVPMRNIRICRRVTYTYGFLNLFFVTSLSDLSQIFIVMGLDVHNIILLTFYFFALEGGAWLLLSLSPKSNHPEGYISADIPKPAIGN